MDGVLLINDQWRHRQHLLLAYDLSFYYYQHFFDYCFLTSQWCGPGPLQPRVYGLWQTICPEGSDFQSKWTVICGKFDGHVWKVYGHFSLYWTNESKTEIESLRRLLHIWPRTFESIIIRISLFWFSFDGKQFCSIKIISLKGSTLVQIIYWYQKNFLSLM